MSPASFGRTLGRELRPGVDFHEAEISGFGRRWNYGVMHTVGSASGPDGAQREWTIVALGVVEAAAERVHGVVAWVDEDELVELDRRERHYDRVEVTDVASVPDTADVSGTIVTYVPRPEARRHYEAARDSGVAAVERRYWDLVDDAFAALGPDRRERYHASTPAPDIPVIELRRETVRSGTQ